MAPWPEQGNEPKAPDKSCNKSGENSSLEASKVNVGNTEDSEVNTTTAKCDDKQADDHNAHVSNLDDGQLRALLDEAIAYKCPKDREGKSNLFRELLQEAEANEDGDTRRGLAGVGGSRYYSNSNRRRGRRDAQVSERQHRGGSLQNLVHASNAEFDPAAGFGGYHSGGSRSARKSKRLSTGSGSYGSGSGGSGIGRDCGGISVSARQREGGSLPSNVNVGGMLTLSGLDYHTTPTSLPFDDIKSCKQVAARRKEFIHSSSSNEFTSMPVQASTINSSGSGSGGVESGSALVPNNSCIAPKPEFMVLDLGDYVGENTGESKGGNSSSVGLSNNVTSTSSANTDNGLSTASQSEEKKSPTGDSNGAEEGLELEVLQRAEVTTRVPNYTSRAMLEVGHGEKKSTSLNAVNTTDSVGEVDTTVTFPLEILQCTEKTSSTPAVNGVEQNSLQLQSSYTSVKSVMSSSSSSSGPRDEKSIISKVTSEKHESSYSGLTTWYADFVTVKRPTREDVNRLTFTHGSSKDCSGESKNKSLDENGNAVNRLESTNSNSTERKGKQRKTKTNNDRNVIMSQNIEGYRGDKDIDTVLKFIESNSDGKGTNKTKNATSHSNGPMNFSSKQQRNCSRLIGCGTKPRRERGAEDPSGDEDRMGKGRAGTGKQVTKEHRGKGSKLKKSNSLEEISKTKLEDLTSNSKEGSENGVTGEAGNNEEGASELVRRPKKQSTLDNGEFYGEKGRVGDRRSWGTEEGQQYYCNDGVTVSADESSSGSGQTSRKRRGNPTVTSSLTSDEKRKSEREEGVSATAVSAGGGSGASEETEFHVVRKKYRRNKRRSSSGGRGTSASTGGSIFGDDSWRPSCPNYSTSYYQNRDGGGGPYYQRKTFTNTSSGFPPHDRTVERDSGGVMLYTQYRHHRPRSPDHLRRKSTSSMPPSDKSDSSDLDSVHSLPVSSTTPKLTLDQTSTSSGSTPQASYADIARMASTNVPPAPTHTHNYVTINLNANRWPVMGMPKSAATTSTGVVTTSNTNPVSVPSSSSSLVISPVVSSNPQFITGPKLNIGVPPVSGSKVAVSASNSALGLQNTNPSTVPVAPGATPEDVGQASSRRESDAVRSSEQIPVCKVRSTHSPPTDTRTKKDAMTNTSLDYGTVSPCSSEEKDTCQVQGNGSRPVETVVNFLRDGEYPSLEESLGSDKSKSMKVSQLHSTHSQFLGENNSLLTSFVNSPNKDKSQSSHVATVCETEKDDVANEKRLQILPIDPNVAVISAAAATIPITTTTTTTITAAVATTITMVAATATTISATNSTTSSTTATTTSTTTTTTTTTTSSANATTNTSSNPATSTSTTTSITAATAAATTTTATSNTTTTSTTTTTTAAAAATTTTTFSTTTTSSSTASSSTTTSLATISSTSTTTTSASPETCVPDSVVAAAMEVSSVQSVDLTTDVAKLKEANLCKSKNSNKKANSSGSRPPVIIMDESDQVFPYSDGLATVSELTFGFEVNEQLLMSDTTEDVEGKVGTSVFVPDSTTSVVEEANPVAVSTAASSATIISSPGEDFSARYREPLTQPDNHDKIVTFIGLAWDDVLKEMNSSPIHSGGKVQYYNGQ
ncbi:hypothetical protein R5R35_014004 [Gryllus longicercus]|uniref:Uncharacterized protein n=1 Tax=Gryllus longicercus TaxID=2509291 RepID=A0AAN9VZT3_9ORTH